MKPGLFPALAVLVLALGAGLAVPALADVPGPVYDTTGAQYVVPVNASGTPQPAGSGINMYADNGSGTPIAVQAGAGNDAVSNPTAALQDRSFNYGYNGTTWDRLRTAATWLAGTGATGLAAAAHVIYDNGSAAYYVARSSGNDGANYAQVPAAGLYGYNGAGGDRVRVSTVGTGILVAAPPDYSYTHIAAGQATTTVKSGAGSLHMICFNSAAAATNVTTVYDNTAASGTVIAIPTVTGLTFLSCVQYDLKFGTGLTINTATANGSDMTVVYR